MIVLGLDTATMSTTVGLRRADGSILQRRDDPGPEQHPGHATRLLAMSDELLAQAQLGWSEIERIAVGLGPGRFTGLRVGIATARGLSQSLSVGLVGVSSLQALAHGAREQGHAGGLITVIDALRGEVFAAAYPAGEQHSRDGLAAAELGFERPLKPQDLEQIVTALAQRGCAPERPWLAIGDGAVRFRAQLQQAGVNVADDASPLHRIDGGAICGLGACAETTSTLQDVLPDYRRTPDAALASEHGVRLQGAST